MRRAHDMPFGAACLPGGGARFRLFAPDAGRVELLRPATGAADPMVALGDGFHVVELARAEPGLRYAFRIDGGMVVPDPASRSNPQGVHAASELVDPLAFDWPDAGWRGRPWHEAVLYELHVGCFTPEGTFDAAARRLDALSALGVTAISLMPLAAFPGTRGWGYDGVLPYAPHRPYGPPEALKRLVAEAHRHGLMVLLDVVYNHFGPDGNYLHAYAKPFFDETRSTPWGAAIHFDGAHGRTVREFFIHNALYWLEEYHFDGLRLDAVHAMHDRSPRHVVDELAERVRAGPGRRREVHVVLENHDNEAVRLARDAAGRPSKATAQWNDDVHHAMHVIATGEADGYYGDFADDPLARLGRGLAEGFVFQGEPSPYAGGRPRGSPSARLPPTAFVNALQTHDQVGNRAHGERIAALAEAAGRADALGALTACLLLAPSIPMLFMGEEYAAGTPFLYFCEHAGELARAVTEGRRREFSRFARFADAAGQATIPDPNDEQTFLRSRLEWAEREREPHARWLALVTELLHVRRQHLVPWLPRAGSGSWSVPTPGTLCVEWPLGEGRRWHLLARLAPTPGSSMLAPGPRGRRIFGSHRGADALPPWSATVVLQEP